jgi:transposase
MVDYERVVINGKDTEYFVSRTGEVVSDYKNQDKKVLKVFITKHGYHYVKLWINDKTKAEFIHRLVARAYIENPEHKPEVNHTDGDKANNCVENLEWVTSQENKQHAITNGLARYAKGEESGVCKYTDLQIINTCELLVENKHTIEEISEITGVSVHTIYGIRTKTVRHDITKNYNFPLIQKRNSRAYTEEQIREVCQYLEDGFSVRDILNMTEVKISTICDIKAKRRWRHISDLFDI